jgi:hypothetical protein
VQSFIIDLDPRDCIKQIVLTQPRKDLIRVVQIISNDFKLVKLCIKFYFLTKVKEDPSCRVSSAFQILFKLLNQWIIFLEIE